jgi:Ser/Thr protein kinase RdoA (MazF antagonist)
VIHLNSYQSNPDASNLLQIINQSYPVEIDHIDLHRDMIGYVYIAKSNSRKYVFKLYRSFDSENALRSIQIILFLKENDYPVVSIVPTGAGGTHIQIDTPQGQSVAVLYDYIEGTEPILDNEITQIGRQVGWLHRLMKEYPQPLIKRGKDFYIDRFISILHEKNYDPKKIDDMEVYGRELWNSIARLSNGFCHGDLHSGNMLQTGANQFVLYDFDIASYTTPVIDAATLSDGTDFNNFDEASYSRTLRMFERFYTGYCKERELNDVEIAAIFDFIAIRHYELIATITQCHGLDDLSNAFLDEQYDWLMQWKNRCDVCQR